VSALRETVDRGVDRPARDRVAEELRRWLRQESTNGALLAALTAVESDDPTVGEVVGDARMFVGTDPEQKAVLYKHGWERLQRLLLVLASNQHIESGLTSRPQVALQIASGATLAGLIVGCVVLEAWPAMVALWAACGVVGVALFFRKVGNEHRSVGTVEPFSSEEELLAVARSVPGFAVAPPPAEVTEYPPRSWLHPQALLAGLLMIVAAPLVLLYLLTPRAYRVVTSRVVPAAEGERKG